MPLEISTPFNIGEDGRVDTTADPDVQIHQHVLALINTTPPERVMLPSYGVNALSMVFEDADAQEVGTVISGMITNAFGSWEPGVSLDQVVPTVIPGENISQIDVMYSRLDAADTTSAANVNVAIIGADGTVKELVSG